MDEVGVGLGRGLRCMLSARGSGHAGHVVDVFDADGEAVEWSDRGMLSVAAGGEFGLAARVFQVEVLPGADVGFVRMDSAFTGIKGLERGAAELGEVADPTREGVMHVPVWEWAWNHGAGLGEGVGHA